MELFRVIKLIDMFEEAVASQIETADVVQVPLFNGRHELLDSVFYGNLGKSIVYQYMMQI